MTQVFHDIERKIITSLRNNPKQITKTLESSTELSSDQVRRGIEWLKLKGLAVVDESKTSTISLGKNGLESFQKGLPERRLLDLLNNGPRKLSDLQKELGFVFGPAMGLARKNNWVDVTADQITLKNIPSVLPGEKTLRTIGGNKLSINEIDKIYVNRGPGSFAGIRNSLSIVKGLFLTQKIDYYCFSFLDFDKSTNIKHEDVPILCDKFEIKKNLIKPLYLS